jgi:tripartite ATP-independent transporter DctM subunit
LLGVTLAGTIAIVFAGVISRSIFNYSLVWTLEATQLGLLILTFLGGASAYGKNQFMAVSLLTAKLPAVFRGACDALGDLIVLLMSVSFVAYFVGPTVGLWQQRTPILGISLTLVGLPLILGMSLFTIYSLTRLRRRTARSILIAVGVLVVVGGGLAVLRVLSDATIISPVGFEVAVAIVLILMVLGVPIGFGLATASLAYTFANGTTPIASVVTTMQNSMDGQFVLVALPIFVLAGAIMTLGGLSKSITRLLSSFLGNVRGGLFHVSIVAMYLFSGISGSKLADITAVGSSMKESYEKEGYDPAEAASVLAAGAAMGETVPPSIAMIVLGSLISSISIATLFEAGLLPAAVVGITLMVVAYVKGGSRVQEKSARIRISEVAVLAVRAMPALLVPVILIGGIVFGIATPTEVSTFAVIYGAFAGVVFYRSASLKQIWRLVVESAVLSGMILFIVSAAATYSWALAIANVPERVASLLQHFSGSPTLFLAASAVVMIVMGSFLEG